jgi:beta-glucuronidase
MNSRLLQMPRAVSALAVALLTLVATAALALAQSGRPGQEAPAQTPRPGTLYGDGHEGRYLLGGTWYFVLDPADQGEANGLPANPSVEGWSTTRVPNAWNATDESDASQRGTIGWYRKDFVLPSKDAALGWKIRFESVNYRAKVWLNGELVGTHEGAFVPFEVPTRGLARTGVNRLVIRVDSRRGRGDVPRGGDRANGRPGGGWWNYGGLLREVYLRRFERVDIESVRVRHRIGASQKRAWLRFRINLDNPSARAARFRLRMRLGGVMHESRPITVGSGGRRTVSQQIVVDKPRLWAPGAPELYPRGSRPCAGTTGSRATA